MPKLRQLIAASCCTATLLLAACGKSESEPKTMLYYSQHLDEAREKVARYRYGSISWEWKTLQDKRR